MTETKLKPCPFCGSEVGISEGEEGEDGLDGIWLINCSNCPAEMRGYRTSIPSKPTVVKGDTYLDTSTGKKKEWTDKEIQYLNVDRFGKDEKEDLIKAWNMGESLVICGFRDHIPPKETI